MDYDQRIRSTILNLCKKRGPEKTICPSEVARNLFPSDWRRHMDEVRREARTLAARGDILITRGSNLLDPNAPFGGPIRLRMRLPVE